MKRMILAAQQEDAAKRRLQAVLLREGFTLVRTEEEDCLLRGSGEPLVMLTYQLTLTTSGTTAPVETVTMVARPEEIFLHTGGLRMERVEFGRLAIDYKARTVTVGERELPLTLKEFELLAYLVYHKNLVLTRSQLLAAVWEMDYAGDVRTVDSHIKCLRQKLGEYARCLVTVRGVGYLFQWTEDLIG